MTLDPLLALVARLGVAAVLGAAAAHKLRDRRAFAASLAAYRLLPERSVAIVASALPLAELSAAGLLVSGAGAPAGAVAALALLFVYSGAIAINLARGRREIDCGCFGPGRSGGRLSGWLLVRNAFLGLAAAASLSPVGTRPLVWLDAATAALALAALALLWTASGRLAAIWPALRELREGA